MLRQSRQVDGGKRAPDFALPDTEGRIRTCAEFDVSPALLVAFICNHCPFVLHIADAFAAFARDYADRGLQVVAISSNDTAEFPEDGFERMGPFAARYGFTFPYLYDESQAVARAYDAVCTPDFFGLSRSGTIEYRGRLDEGRKEQPPPGARRELLDAMRMIAGSGKGPVDQRPSVGCSMKWKAA